MTTKMTAIATEDTSIAEKNTGKATQNLRSQQALQTQQDELYRVMNEDGAAVMRGRGEGNAG